MQAGHCVQYFGLFRGRRAVLLDTVAAMAMPCRINDRRWKGQQIQSFVRCGEAQKTTCIVQLYFLHNYTFMVRSGVRASIQNTNTRGLYLMHGTAAFCSCSLLSRTFAISSADNLYILLSPYSVRMIKTPLLPMIEITNLLIFHDNITKGPSP